MDKNQIEDIHKMAQIALGKQITMECTEFAIKEGFFDNFIALFNAGYRKIPKGLVVLTEEEFSEFRQTIITQAQEYTKKCDEMNDKIIKARKQIVEEVLEKINERLCTFKLENKSQEFTDGYTEAIDEVCGRLDEIAKWFGVKL